MSSLFPHFALFVLLFAFLAGYAGEKSEKSVSSKHVEVGMVAQSESPLKTEVEDRETFLVTRTIDGDTIEIASGVRIRLIGINAPEIGGQRTSAECFGIEAARRTKELIEGKQIALERDVSETDAYGRLLRYVYINGIMLNELLVREGYAHASAYPPDVKYANQLRDAEHIARARGSGLWSKCPTNASVEALSLFHQEDGCIIKGNISRAGRIYHMPGCQSYEKTVINESAGERWFCSIDEAEAAGWRRAKNCP